MPPTRAGYNGRLDALGVTALKLRDENGLPLALQVPPFPEAAWPREDTPAASWPRPRLGATAPGGRWSVVAAVRMRQAQAIGLRCKPPPCA
jgi:hypothetical protein